MSSILTFQSTMKNQIYYHKNQEKSNNFIQQNKNKPIFYQLIK